MDQATVMLLIFVEHSQRAFELALLLDVRLDRSWQRSTQPRRQYVELKGSVHRKLIGRLNLEALALTDRARAEGDIRALLAELLASESTPLKLTPFAY